MCMSEKDKKRGSADWVNFFLFLILNRRLSRARTYLLFLNFCTTEREGPIFNSNIKFWANSHYSVIWICKNAKNIRHDFLLTFCCLSPVWCWLYKWWRWPETTHRPLLSYFIRQHSLNLFRLTANLCCLFDPDDQLLYIFFSYPKSFMKCPIWTEIDNLLLRSFRLRLLDYIIWWHITLFQKKKGIALHDKKDSTIWEEKLYFLNN